MNWKFITYFSWLLPILLILSFYTPQNLTEPMMVWHLRGRLIGNFSGPSNDSRMEIRWDWNECYIKSLIQVYCSYYIQVKLFKMAGGFSYSDEDKVFITEERRKGTSFLEIARALNRKESAVKLWYSR